MYTCRCLSLKLYTGMFKFLYRYLSFRGIVCLVYNCFLLSLSLLTLYVCLFLFVCLFLCLSVPLSVSLCLCLAVSVCLSHSDSLPSSACLSPPSASVFVDGLSFEDIPT